jgi:hypothetical protein
MLSYVIMLLIVWLGNPLLPIEFLAQYGWAWHHIPEISGIFFLGMWFGSMKLPQYNTFLHIALLLILIAYSVKEIISNFSILYVVIIIVSIPSFVGYVVGFSLTHKKHWIRPSNIS